ncbi:hypothetical protein BJ085DRAFT_20642 [Dimargaris cristalligena]|uniref:SLC41A/MgtE integral membrane domain-containing protein n=1 Tax=Dimargaris cristalligena TaxID=215637 RepID=A0A4V1J5I5_9FUNG|nr:hypothetical protein BJ085DRAFT_20642 [Dimargaris cristalligena]|eukprot:RKP39179.1 hypothetical protein BJ085DRAFT_20642 [Dimargaris cristalligena]
MSDRSTLVADIDDYTFELDEFAHTLDSPPPAHRPGDDRGEGEASSPLAHSPSFLPKGFSGRHPSSAHLLNKHHQQQQRTPYGPVGEDDFDDLESIVSFLNHDPEPVVVVAPPAQGQSQKYLVVQVTPILLIAVVGSMVSGWLFDSVQTWPAFRNVSELFILVSILMNLKGNLEVNLSSRLSTLANLGELEDRANRLSIVFGNLILLLFQTLTVGFIAGVLSSVLGLISFTGSPAALESSPVSQALALPIPGHFSRAVFTIVVSMLSSFVGSLMIGLLICVTVYASHRCGVDPDNVAIPITSSFGDMTTVLLLSRFGQGLYELQSLPLLMGLLTLLLALLAACFHLTRQNKRIRPLMGAGWSPLAFALGVTSIAGLLVKTHVTKFHALAVLLPVFNGTVGNICTIFASRISTHLHAGTQERYGPVMVMLFLINLPVHWIFLTFVRLLNLAHGALDWKLWLFYTIACLFIVFIMLSLAKALTLLIWSWNYDPDNYTNPFLTSISDFSGTIGLITVFYILQQID